MKKYSSAVMKDAEKKELDGMKIICDSDVYSRTQLKCGFLFSA